MPRNRVPALALLTAAACCLTTAGAVSAQAGPEAKQGTAQLTVGAKKLNFSLTKCASTGRGPQLDGTTTDNTRIRVVGSSQQLTVRGRSLNYDGRIEKFVKTPKGFQLSGVEGHVNTGPKPGGKRFTVVAECKTA